MTTHLTPDEVAERFGGKTTPKQVRTLIHRRQLRAIRIGRKYRIPLAEVERFERVNSTAAA